MKTEYIMLSVLSKRIFLSENGVVKSKAQIVLNRDGIVDRDKLNRLITFLNEEDIFSNTTQSSG